VDRLDVRLAQRHPHPLDDLEARLTALEERVAAGDEDAAARLERVQELFRLARERRDARYPKTGVRLPP